MTRCLSIIIISILFFSCSEQKKKQTEKHIKRKVSYEIDRPEQLYGDLFYDVQSRSIFKDSKTFVDCIPKRNTNKILSDYGRLNDKSDSALKVFVLENFSLPQNVENYKNDSLQIEEHITELWNVLKREADDSTSGTLIPLPHSYIVPGGRFREVYYWDSYFTMLGLKNDNRKKLIEDMVDNFNYLITTFGHVPNGNRTYYLSRSQPPYFCLMVELLAEIKGEKIFIKHLNALQLEYNFWMNGQYEIKNLAKARVVKLDSGLILNRYWDNDSTPRPESYREDVVTANNALQNHPDKTQGQVYRDLRAAAESGWDFSSRWFAKNDEGSYSLNNIHTTDIIPVDLNTLLYHLEEVLSKAYKLDGKDSLSDIYLLRKNLRKQAINNYCWNEEKGFFSDYDFVLKQHTPVISLAGIYPLFFGIADSAQAQQMATKIEAQFLQNGGLTSTLNNSGEQWDAPNGWAPLHYLAIQGLRKYGYVSLAQEIEERWLGLNERVYNSTFKLMEKYNVYDMSLSGGGGEYPTQDGFGWTNGVYKALSSEKVK